MIKYIIANKKWIFSGIGVLALTLLIGMAKYYWFDRAALGMSEPQEEATPQILRRYSQEQRVSVGDFHVFMEQYSPIRVQVLEIRRLSVRDVVGAAKEEYVAHLEVSRAGLVGGSDVREVGRHSYLIPALDQGERLSTALPETERCLFDFSTQESYFSFRNVCVTHINTREQSVDVKVQEVRE